MQTGVTGFCMRCKESVIINNPLTKLMSNGRTRVYGTCSKPGCVGKISKIIS